MRDPRIAAEIGTEARLRIAVSRAMHSDPLTWRSWWDAYLVPVGVTFRPQDVQRVRVVWS